MSNDYQKQLNSVDETSSSSDGYETPFNFSCIGHSPLQEYFEGIYWHYHQLQKNNDEINNEINSLRKLTNTQTKKIEELEAEIHKLLNISDEKDETIKIITNESIRLQTALENSQDTIKIVTLNRDELLKSKQEILVEFEKVKKNYKSSVTLTESETMRQSQPEMEENNDMHGHDDGNVTPQTPCSPNIKITSVASYADLPKSPSATTATTAVKFEVVEEPLEDEDVNSIEIRSCSAPGSTNADKNLTDARVQRSRRKPLKFFGSMEAPPTKKKRTSKDKSRSNQASTENENLPALRQPTEATGSIDNLTVNAISSAQPITRKRRKCRR